MTDGIVMRKIIGLSLPVELLARVKVLCQKAGISRAEFFRQSVADYVAIQEKKLEATK